ncbi:hypothetical protein AC244_08305 [Ensifer adhaerens]|uniref:Uncharacterized protein n=1 Tax=Ensifer adhaerens TaxID=106592 RepID=A0A0L8C369_ENSAD|nr:hypothetical protein [Ensifer adhaerens]KOF21340.1 hypothetical protein AC244_08305 [Ensifer adhaerens]
MKNILINTAAAVVIGLTGLVGAASTASAETIEFGFGPRGGVDVQYRDYDRDYGDEGDWGRDRRGRDRHWDGGRRSRCAPWMAVDKARDHGLRRAYVADVSRRRIVVEGSRRGYHQTIAFANVRGCPVIGRW